MHRAKNDRLVRASVLPVCENADVKNCFVVVVVVFVAVVLLL